MKPTAEAELYDNATVAEPLVEDEKTVLPVSGIGMQARKRALREGRAVPARIAREKAEAEAAEKARLKAKAEGAEVAAQEARKAERQREFDAAAGVAYDKAIADGVEEIEARKLGRAAGEEAVAKLDAKAEGDEKPAPKKKAKRKASKKAAASAD